MAQQEYRSSSVNLANFFKKTSVIKRFILGNAEYAVVPDRKMWIITGGRISHVTGTTSVLTVYDGDIGGKTMFYVGVDTDQATAVVPLFGILTTTVATSPVGPQGWSPHILPGGSIVYFVGDATANVVFEALEADIL